MHAGRRADFFCGVYQLETRFARIISLEDEQTARTLGVVVLTLSHGYNAVRGHRTGSNNSGMENYLRRKTNTPEYEQKMSTKYSYSYTWYLRKK